MQLNEYQDKAKSTDLFEAKMDLAYPGLIEKVFGLAGESGEVCDKVKKLIRDKNGEVSDEARIEIKKELGDVLWYTASIARYFNLTLEDVAQSNLDKLASRQSRNMLSGSGDNR